MLRSPMARSMLDALRRDLDDPQRWLVFADWLTDRGDIRGQLVHFDHQLRDETLPAAERQRLRQQIAAIEHTHRPQWRAALPLPEGARPVWRHGFLVGVWLPWNNDTIDLLAALRAHPDAALLSALSLSDDDIDGEGAAVLAASPALAGLTSLDLSDNRIGDEGVAALVASATLVNLTSLHLDRNHIGAKGAAAIASSPALANLDWLCLYGNRLGDKGTRMLTTSPTLANLSFLGI